MTRNTHHFDRWLDAFVNGKSTPGNELASDESSTLAASGTLQKTARQFHDLAAQADRQDSDATTTDRLDRIWENIMIPATAPVTGNPSAGPNRTVPPATTANPHHRTRSLRWQSIVNSLLAAALILGLSFGIWQTWDRFNTGGNGGNPEPSHIAALLPANDATPESAFTPGELPTAEECTVTPLTVDDVMEIVDDPYLTNRQVSGELIGTPEEVYSSSTFYNRPPSQEDLDAIGEAHRQWIACITAGNWFQVWALTDRIEVQREVRDWLYPTYLTRQEGRSLLVELEQNGKADDLQTTTIAINGDIRIPLVDPNPQHSNQPIVGYGYVQVGMIIYGPNGAELRSRSAAIGEQLPLNQYITYKRDPFTGQWKISQIELGGEG